ncbi:serine/threonine-protein kinase prpf4B-like isoform X2 [Trichogramma pretiosum]|uniref:serine/threonine-protein kinase prpf4B-like isoform X2 n=1 Tax=Trichogramma pretiosum TaxID=7493 RepID=UPI0006C9AE17|nr:serine/threonine-protein kinase prpf4B-like isoform X2 [Trichogramma pretiosum]
MSDHDEALLDEDLGDEVYDLGNDEEEALLADDEIDNERLPVQQSYSSKADEETDDILDLGVTDAFDDLVTEDENIQSKTKSHVEVNICQKNDIPNELSSNELRKSQIQEKSEAVKSSTKYESIGDRGRQQNHSDEEPSVKQKIDLREKLKERNNFNKHNHVTDDEDGEELKERRNRFQSERTVVPTKANQEIPDSLEKVVTSDQHVKTHNRRERDKNRDRSERFERRTLANRPGGRYDPHLPIRYHHGPLPQTPGTMHYRPENRSAFQCGNSASGPLPLGVSNLGQPRHSMYPPIPSYHHPQKSGPHPHYNDPQLSAPMLPNQYPEPMQPSQLPSLVPGPLMDYRSRGLAPPPPGIGQAPAAYGLAPHTFPPAPYSQHMNEHSSVPVMTGNQANQPLPPHRPSTYDSRMTSSYEPGYEMRPKPPANFGQTPSQIGVPYSNQSLQQCRPQPSVTATPQEVNTSQKLLVTPSVNSVSNVPVIPTGHKILINPHFKGKIDNKTLHDPAETFVQALRNASNSSSRDGRSSSNQAKSDDPFSYFSDMWQESKSQRVQNSHSHRSYSPENNYNKSSNHDKFKSEPQWSHKNEHLEAGSKKNYDSRDYIEHKKSRDMYREKDREREKEREKDKERKREKDLSPKSKSDVTDSLLKNSHKIDDHENLVNKSVHEEKKKFSHHSGKETVRTVVKRASDTPIDKFTVDKVAKKLKIPAKNSASKNAEENIIKEEELDPEMKEYRMKMEEQKRLREKIILEKENRRKLAAMEKNKSEHSTNSNEIDKARVQLTIVSTEKETKKGKINLSAAKTLESLTNVHSSEESSFGFQSLNEMKKYRKKNVSNVLESEQKSIEESKGDIEKITESDQESDDDSEESNTAMSDYIEKVSDKSDEDDGGKSKLLSRIVLGRNKRVLKTKLDQSSIIQKPTVNAHRQLGQIRKLLANSCTQRVVVSPASKIQQKNNAGAISQRNIVHKSDAKKLLKSNIVRVDNLAATTTEHQIRKMCQGIGSIESIQMGDGNATIIFKTQSAAMVFHKKYQRKMLDLSLIKVQLISQISMSKNSSEH